MEMDRRIWHVGTAVLILVTILSARLVYWQLIRGEELQPVVLNPISGGETSVDRSFRTIDTEILETIDTLPLPVQQRTSELLSNITRGSIFDRNGQVLATDVVDETGFRSRGYLEMVMAPILGYTSGLRVGLTGIEQHFNETLFGLDRFDGQVSRIIHQPIVGNNVYLTVDTELQKATADILGDRRGSVVIMDAQSGAVLAMVSNPTFDPNRILDPAYAEELINCDAPGCQGTLINRATQGLYIPGSTWKTVTLIAALDSGQVTPETVFDFGQQRNGPNGRYYVYEVDGAEFRDPNHPESRLNLVRSYAVSANAAFARMGDELPPEVLISYAQSLGFSQEGNPLPIEVQTSPAQLANDLDELRSNNVLQASTGFGQGEILASPLNMALIVCAVVNNGNIPLPHLLLRVENPNGEVIRQSPTGFWAENVMRPETAQQVRDMMIAVVQSGSGVGAAVSGLTIGGKTGTAEVAGQQPHAWFIGFADNGNRTLAISVIVENGGEGADVAAPIFAQVARLALLQQ
jgi:peptidoglycan glycosyltransferase